MPVCPSCGGEMLISKLAERFGVTCLRCGIRYFAPARDEKTAYENFTTEFGGGMLKLETARSFEELTREMAGEGSEFEALPSAVKKLLPQS